MDNFEQYLETWYNDGLRARLLHPGDVHVYTVKSVDKYYPVENPDVWQALRAYQDEQRKKGEPILLNPVPMTWAYGDFWSGEDFLKRRHPVIVHFKNGMPHRRGNELGRFVNFRWRPGHGPKAEHYPIPEHCGGSNCPFEHSCVDGCMYPKPKGGSNGQED